MGTDRSTRVLGEEWTLQPDAKAVLAGFSFPRLIREGHSHHLALTAFLPCQNHILNDDQHMHTAYGPGTTLVLKGRVSKFKVSRKNVWAASHPRVPTGIREKRPCWAKEDASITPSSSPEWRAFLQITPRLSQPVFLLFSVKRASGELI